MIHRRRIKADRLKTYTVRARSVSYDAEGVPVVSYGDAVKVKGELWPATSKRQIETYGDRVKGIQNLRVQGSYEMQGAKSVVIDGKTVSLGDAVTVYTENDYQVISITEADPLLLEIEAQHG